MPKNAVRRKLIEDGRMKTLFISREENYASIDEKVKSAFGLNNYKVLECDNKTHQLFISPNQELSGVQAIKRRRNLYLCEVSY